MPYDLEDILHRIQNGTFDKQEITMLSEEEQYSLCFDLLRHCDKKVHSMRQQIEKTIETVDYHGEKAKYLTAELDMELAVQSASHTGWYKKHDTEQ